MKELTQEEKKGKEGSKKGENFLSFLSFLSLSGGLTPCQHLRPSSGREHTIV